MVPLQLQIFNSQVLYNHHCLFIYLNKLWRIVQVRLEKVS